MRQCRCGESYGIYINKIEAKVSEKAVCIGIGNDYLEEAINNMENLFGESKGQATKEDYKKCSNIEYVYVWPTDGGPGNPAISRIQEGKK